MSIFRKALNEMRGPESNPTSGAEDQSRKSSQSTGSNGVPHELREDLPVLRQSDSNRTPAHLDTHSRTQVRKRVQINRDALIAGGLEPQDSDMVAEVSQQFRRIKRPLFHTAFEMDSPVDSNANVIMIASDMPGAGKSFCAFNLAESFSMERDIGVIMVDADVVKPGISEILGMEAEVGLIDYLLEPELELPDILFETNLNGIVVIPSGRRHAQATELLASRRMQSLVSKVSQEFGNYVVIFDTPPLLLTNEAQVLAKIAGQIVLVIESRVSSQESVVRALGLLDRSKPINAIFNKSRGAASNMYSGGNYAYPYWNHSNGRKAN